MQKINQLLTKALSTDNENEAIACLRKARKSVTNHMVDLNGDNKELERMRKLAASRNTAIKSLQRSVHHFHDRVRSLESERTELNHKIKNSVDSAWMGVLLGVYTISIIILVLYNWS